jgi:hypothetical protein
MYNYSHKSKLETAKTHDYTKFSTYKNKMTPFNTGQTVIKLTINVAVGESLNGKIIPQSLL